MDDSNQQVVQVGQGAGRFARCPDALICGRRGVLCQRVVLAAARHPLHDDEGVGRFQARAEYLHAVRVVDLSACQKTAQQAGNTPLAFIMVITSWVNFFNSRGFKVTLILGRFTAASVPLWNARSTTPGTKIN